MRYEIDPAGSAPFSTLRAALTQARRNRDPQAEFRIAQGVYREKLRIDLPGATLNGRGAEKTKIVYGLSAHQTDETGAPLGTFRTPTLTVSANGVTLRNLTVENDAGPGERVEQAVALHIAGDRCAVYGCALVAHQDTLLLAPEGGDIANAGPCGRRAFLSDCLIRGNVDFIFGSYAAWFERCALWCVSRGMDVNAMIAAPNTPEGQRYGFVFHRCRVTGDCEPGTVYLGRPWRPFGKAAFLRCAFPRAVAEAGWLDWGTPFRPVWAGLCETADTHTPLRHPLAGSLAAEEEAAITPEAVLAGREGWRPWETAGKDGAPHEG